MFAVVRIGIFLLDRLGGMSSFAANDGRQQKYGRADNANLFAFICIGIFLLDRLGGGYAQARIIQISG